MYAYHQKIPHYTDQKHSLRSDTYVFCTIMCICVASLVPRAHPAFHCVQYGTAGRGWSQGPPSVSLRAVWNSRERLVPGPTQRFAVCSMEQQGEAGPRAHPAFHYVQYGRAGRGWSQGPPSDSLCAVWNSRERLVPGPTQRFTTCSMEEQGEAGPRAHPAFRCVQYGRAGRGWSQGPPSVSLRAVWKSRERLVPGLTQRFTVCSMEEQGEAGPRAHPAFHYVQYGRAGRGWSQGPPSVSLCAVWNSRERLVPRAHPVFRCVQYGTAGRGWSQGPPSVSLRAVWKSRERLVPRAHPVFRCMQYGRAGRGWSQGPPSVSLRAVRNSRERLIPGPTQGLICEVIPIL